MALENAAFGEELLRLIDEMSNNEEVKSIIQKEDLYNITDASKNTLLHIAAQKNAEITRYLIESGSKVDVQNDRGRTPMMLAVQAVCEETVEVLLEAGANIELKDNLGNDILRIVDDGKGTTVKILKLLLKNLQNVCSNNKEKIVEKLLDAHWPLHYVIDLGDSDLTKIVLQHGYLAKIDQLDGFYDTALHLAVHSGDVENVKVLLEYGANVNILDDSNRTPLCELYYWDADRPNDRLDILKILLERGALIGCDPDDDDAYDMFKYVDREATKLLFRHNIDRSPDFNRGIILEMLAGNKNPGAIEEIHGRGFDVDSRNDDNETPLITAARCGNTGTVEFLLNEGANIHAVDFSRYPVVFHAINTSPNNEQCVQLLLERGADVQYEVVSPLQREARPRGISTVLDLILLLDVLQLGELVVAHLALQEILGTPITETIWAQINSCDRLKTHFESSQRQLALKVYESTTLLDLLSVMTDEKLEIYARNGEFISKTQGAVSALSEYHYFHTILQRRLSKAQTIATLKTAAARVISEIMGISYDQVPLLADRIISCLGQEDMKNLIDASECKN